MIMPPKDWVFNLKNRGCHSAWARSIAQVFVHAAIVRKALARDVIVRGLLLGLLIGLSACATYPTQIEFKTHAQALVEARYYTVEIPSFDGTRLRATVYQPELGPTETAPLILHAHGFAFFRMSRPFSLYGKFLYTGKTALEAWRQGYWVISFDQRGHGGSGGKINVMHPDYEVKDVTYILNWAEENLPRLAYEAADPLVGMIGESYGGGAQLMSAGLDSRIDAIVPVTTWHDMKESFAPNEVPKSGWLTTLFTLGNLLNFGKMDAGINQAYFKARAGEVDRGFFYGTQSHNASHACGCNSSYAPSADALFIQGFRDVLFPVNQAAKNFDCLREAGVDVRLIATQDGHLLPFSQFSKGLPGFNIDDQVHCGARALDTVELAVNWFDEKLKGKVGAADDVPRVCLTHDYQSGTVFNKVPVGGESIDLPRVALGSGFSGILSRPIYLWDRMRDALAKPFRRQRQSEDPWLADISLPGEQGGRIRPKFIPLKHIHTDSLIAGIPIASIKLDTEKEDTVVFLGIGVKKSGEATPRLLSEQINPIRNAGWQSLELSAVSSRLAPGDVLGALVYRHNGQYRFSESGLFTQASLRGNLNLPVKSRLDSEYIVQSYIKPEDLP